MSTNNRTKQIRVSINFANYLENIRDKTNENQKQKIGIPEVTDLLLLTKDAPRVVVAFKKRPGRRGRTLDDNLFK